MKKAPHEAGLFPYFFIVPPGDAASPFLPTEPAVPAPCVLGSLEVGIELPVVVPEPAVLFIEPLSIDPLSILLFIGLFMSDWAAAGAPVL
jgi:hypothetical protein